MGTIMGKGGVKSSKISPKQSAEDAVEKCRQEYLKKQGRSTDIPMINNMYNEMSQIVRMEDTVAHDFAARRW